LKAGTSEIKDQKSPCPAVRQAKPHQSWGSFPFREKELNLSKLYSKPLDAPLVVFHTHAEKLVNLFTHLFPIEQVALQRRIVSKGELS
jgi:hypothetical protein